MLTVSFQNFEEVKRLYDPKVITRALNTTLQRTARSARTEVSRRIRQTYNVKARDIGQVVRLRTRRQGENIAKILEYRGGPLPLDRFGTRPKIVRTDRGKRLGVTAQVRKDRPRKIVRGAFKMKGRSGPTMQRRGDSRLPIDRVFRLSVPQMINRDVLADTQDFIERRANIELNRNLRFWEQKLAR